MSDIEIEKSNIRGEFCAPGIGNYGGDYSFAGMFFARAALDSSVICTNLNAASEQNGKIVLDILRSFGAKITRGGDSVNVRANTLCGCEIDISGFPKIAPVTALLAVFAKGRTHVTGFSGFGQLRGLITENLSALGVSCEYNENDLWIWNQRKFDYTVFNAKNDPYMAMALILMSTCLNGATTIRNVDGLFERYPDFIEIFKSLGGKCRICEFAF